MKGKFVLLCTPHFDGIDTTESTAASFIVNTYKLSLSKWQGLKWKLHNKIYLLGYSGLDMFVQMTTVELLWV